MVRKTKRVLALALTAMMATSALAGCAGGSDGGTQNSSQAPTGNNSATTSGGDVVSDVSVVDVDSDSVKQKLISAIASEAAKTNNEIKITLWCSSDDRSFEKKLVEDFKKEYASDQYTLDVDVNSSYGEDKAGGKIIESPGDGADVFNMADDQISTLVTAGAIAKVGDIFKGNVVANNTEDSVSACTVNGTTYAYPKTSDNGYFMYYDKRVFGDDEVGNLDEMIKKASENGKSVYLNVTGPWYMTGFFFTAGCDITYDVTTDTQVATFNTPEGLKAAKAICHISESEGKGFSGTPGTLGDNAYVQQGFEDGTLAAAVIGTWEGPVIKAAIGEENVGAAKLPTVLMDGKQEQLHSFGGYKVVGVNTHSQYPTTSHILAYYLTKESSQLSRYNERGLIPTNNKALEDETVNADPARKAIQEQAPYAHQQGTSVGGTYWAVNPQTVGTEAISNKGNLSDDKLNEILKNIVTQIDSAKKS